MTDNAKQAVALVPVKAPGKAKSRLADVLEPGENARLAVAMLEDVLTALSGSQHINRVTIVTDDESVAELSRQLGHEVTHDNGDGLCAALDHAATLVTQTGEHTALIIPADIPTVTAADIDALLERHNGGLSISPAIRDGGTNALICTPPDAIPFCFGRNSASRHMKAAEGAGLECNRLPVPAFFRDIDLPEDLAWLCGQQNGARTLEFLQHAGINARLTQLTLGRAS